MKKIIIMKIMKINNDCEIFNFIKLIYKINL